MKYEMLSAKNIFVSSKNQLAPALKITLFIFPRYGAFQLHFCWLAYLLWFLFISSLSSIVWREVDSLKPPRKPLAGFRNQHKRRLPNATG